MKETYSYEIVERVYEITPPIARVWKYGSTATVWETINGKGKAIYTTHEVWGETQDEAIKKAVDTAKKWLQENHLLPSLKLVKNI